MKSELRQQFSRIRRTLAVHRRREAQAAANTFLQRLCSSDAPVVSYASMGDELDLWLLNGFLASQGQLILPRVEKRELVLYQVHNLEKQLIESAWGILEPDPLQCQSVKAKTPLTMLVPALAFDYRHHRLGYGKGFYDRLLAKQGAHVTSYGVGFTEQFLHKELPTSSHDIALTDTYLF